MLTRVLTIAGLLATLAGLNARIGFRAVKHAGATYFGYVAAALLAMVATLGLLGAGYLAIAPYLSHAGALAAVSGALLGIAAIVLLVARSHRDNDGPYVPVRALREQFDAEEQRLRDACGMSNKSTEPESNTRPTPSAPATIVGLGDPMLLAAAGVAAAGLLGPARLYRTIRLAATIMPFVASRAADRSTRVASLHAINKRDEPAQRRSGAG